MKLKHHLGVAPAPTLVLIGEDAGCQVDQDVYDEIVDQAARSQNGGCVVVDTVDIERELAKRQNGEVAGGNTGANDLPILPTIMCDP